ARRGAAGHCVALERRGPALSPLGGRRGDISLNFHGPNRRAHAKSKLPMNLRLPLLVLLLLLCPFRSPALDWQTNGPHRYAAVTVPAGGKPGFTLLSPAVTGINFTNVLPQSRHLTNHIL